MLRPGAVDRVMRERNPPPHRRIVRKRLLDEVPVLRILVEPLAAAEILLRRIDAYELDVGSVAEAVEQPGAKRRAFGGFFRPDALGYVEVVFHLRAIVAIFRFF